MSSILIVDDELDSSLFIAQYLEKQGYQTRLAKNGEEALAILLNSRPSAVILDIRMPRMDGITLLQIMRSYLRWASLPVIVLSANATDEELDKARDLGVCCVFRKAGFQLGELLLCLNAECPPSAGLGAA